MTISAQDQDNSIKIQNDGNADKAQTSLLCSAVKLNKNVAACTVASKEKMNSQKDLTSREINELSSPYALFLLRKMRVLCSAYYYVIYLHLHGERTKHD